MKNRVNSVFAIVLCLVIALSCFTACSVKKSETDDNGETIPGEENWSAGGSYTYQPVEITGVELAEIVSEALGEEAKTFNGNLNSLSTEQVQKVKQTAEEKGYVVEDDDSGNTVIKKEVAVTEVNSEEYSEILSEAEVTNVTKLSEEEYKKVSKAAEENGVTAITDEEGDLEIVSKVVTTAPVAGTTGGSQGVSDVTRMSGSTQSGQTTAGGNSNQTAKYTVTTASTKSATVTYAVATTAAETTGIKSNYVTALGGKGAMVFTGNDSLSDGTVSAGNSFVNASGKSVSESCGIIAVHNAKGKLQWKDIIEGNDSVFFEDVATLSDGSIVVAADSLATNLTSAENYKCQDTFEIFLIKYSAKGDKLWTKVIGGSDEDSVASICATPDGGFVIGGAAYSHDGDFKKAVSASSYAYVAKFDGNGNLGWIYTVGGSKVAECKSVSVNSKGEVFAAVQTAATDGSFSDAESREGKTRSYAYKLTSTGALSWKKEIYETGKVLANTIIGLDDGGCTIAGEYSCSADGNKYTFKDFYNGGRTGTMDAFVMCIDSGSYKRWILPLIGFENDYLTGIAKVPGGYAVCGYTESSNRDFNTTNYGDLDSYIYFVSEYGEKQTYATFAGSECDRAMAICANGNEVYTAGTSTSSDYYFKDCEYKGADDRNIAFVAKYTAVQ